MLTLRTRAADAARAPDTAERFDLGIIGRARTLLATAFAVTVVACAPPDEGVEVAVQPAPQRERFGVVSLTYSEAEASDAADGTHDHVVQPVQPVQLVAQAFFVEHSGIDRAHVLRLLSSPVDGLVDPEIPVDACVVEERDVAAADIPESASVRLLDAGELMLETGADTSLLDSHYFPEMYSAVSGLAYDGVLDDRHAFAYDRPLTVSADGSDEVGALSVSLVPPPIVHLHSVGGAPPTHAHAWLPDDGGGLEVTWQTAAARDPGPGAPIAVVRYVRRGFDHLARVTCAAADDGAFTIPEAALALLPDLGAEQTDRVVVERIQAAPFSGAGMPNGLAVAIASDAVVLE